MQLAQKIIIADDHPLFRTAMQQAVKQLVPDVTIAQAESLPELQQVVEQHKDADLILLDLQMPGAHGYSGPGVFAFALPGNSGDGGVGL